MHGDLLSFLQSWNGFLPANAVVMGRHSAEVSSVLAPEKTNPFVYSFYFQTPGIDSPAASELFHKIAAALELKESDYAFGENLPRDATSRILIQFILSGAEAPSAGHWENDIQGSLVLKTFSLSAMLESPALKKPVWNHLKDAQARLREEST